MSASDYETYIRRNYARASMILLLVISILRTEAIVLPDTFSFFRKY